jgi:YbbR domain-containing protein
MVDCRDYKPVNGRVVIAGASLEELLGGMLSSSAHIQSVSPDTIQYYLAPSVGRRLPVRLTGSITSDASHVIGSQSLTPDSITVHAPRNVLDTMKCVYTEPVAFDNLSDSVSAEVALVLPQRGVLFEPESARLSVQVTPYVEKSFELPVEGWLMPRDAVVKTFPSKATVTFQVSLEQFHAITPEQFKLAVSYTELNADDGGKAHLQLIQKPDDIRSISISPAEVDYVIEINETP